MLTEKTLERLRILAESAKYDVSCSSSGTVRGGKQGTELRLHLNNKNEKKCLFFLYCIRFVLTLHPEFYENEEDFVPFLCGVDACHAHRLQPRGRRFA